jgi:hypothetical protein
MLFLHILSRKLKHGEGTNKNGATTIPSVFSPSSSSKTDARKWSYFKSQSTLP